MTSPAVNLYYKNVLADVIGSDHGITQSQLDELAAQTQPAIAEVNQQRQSGKIPYRDLPYQGQTVNRIQALVDALNGQCDIFVVLGIGGSALGNIALQTALNSYMYNIDPNQRKGPQFFVFDNVDPAQLGSFLQWASDRLERTIFNVISKSGRTAETASQLLTVRKMLLDKLGPDGFKNQVVATTDVEEGTLRKIANVENLRCLEVPDGVGGRFSVLSDVGLFGAAMCGIDIEGLLAGAAEMDKRVSDEDFFNNPAAINAAINYHMYQRGKHISVMMPYSYQFKDMADWYRQLWAESLGKTHDLQNGIVHIGPTPVKALGTTDQHSQVQLYREGPNDKLFTFLEVKSFNRSVEIGPAPPPAPELTYLAGKPLAELLNSEKKATEFALLQDRRPCLSVIFDKVDAHTVGQFIYLFEVTTSIAGVLFNINAYNQPAVELGKEATFALMGREGFAQMAQKITPAMTIDDKYMV